MVLLLPLVLDVVVVELGAVVPGNLWFFGGTGRKAERKRRKTAIERVMLVLSCAMVREIRVRVVQPNDHKSYI